MAEYLYTDENQYNKYLKAEQDLKRILTDLELVAVKALGTLDNVDNYKALIEQPGEYLVIRYWDLFGEGKPLHLNKTVVFRNDTNVRLDALEGLSKAWKEIVQNMGEHAPSVNADGIIWNVKEDDFKHYLSDEKKSHYSALKRLLKAVNEVKKHEGNSNFLPMFRCSDNLTIDGMQLDIKKEKFV